MKRTYTPGIVACAALVIALIGYFWWYHAVAVLSAQASSLTNALAARTRAETRISVAQAQLADLSNQESAVDNYFVSNVGIVPFIEHLQSIASSAGATASILSVAGGTGSNSSFTIALNITGDFDHVVRAVGAIEYAPYDLTVSGLTLTSSSGAGQALASAGPVRWQANMTVVVGATGSGGSTAASTNLMVVPSIAAPSAGVSQAAAAQATSSQAQP